MNIRMDMRGVLPTMANLLVVTSLAVLGISAGKFIFTKWPVKGFTELFQGV